MANPTTNYGWPMPTSTDLVTDLPADFAAFGQPVDTTLKALNPETTLGDIAYRSATSNTNTRLGIGTNGQVLAVSGGVPAWTTTADVTPLTTKGDLFTFDTADARLGVGTNGQTLVADSSTSTGLKWATPAAATSGLTLIKRASTSGAVSTGTTFDSVFSSTYSNYWISIESWSVATDDDDGIFQFRASAATQNSSYYGISQQTISTTTTNNAITNATGVTLTYNVGDTARYTPTTMNLYVRHVGGSTVQDEIFWQGMSAGTSGTTMNMGVCLRNNSFTADGFILSAASNIACTVAVYGLAKS